MDVTGVVFGSISLLSLLTTVETCVRGYDRFISSAREAPSKSSKFAIHIRIEQRKFQLYWEYMGLSDTDCPLLAEQSRRTQELIVDVACEIEALLSDARVLSDGYGIEGVPKPGNGDLEMGDLSTASTSNTTTILGRLRQSNSQDWFGQRPKLTRRQSLLWVWKDERKAMDLLNELRQFNEQLWTSLAPQHEILLKQGEPAWLLPGLNDVWAIQRLAGTGHSDSDNPLTVCSSLRSARLQVGAMERMEVHDMEPAGLEWDRDRTILGSSCRLGSLNGRNVIVEYKRIAVNLSTEDRDISKERLQSLMRLLARKTHPMLRILRGVTMFTNGLHSNEFGLVFECPAPLSGGLVNYVTLEHLLASRKTNNLQALGRRFKLAQALAKSIMLLHAAGWYHKNLKPEVVIFQQVGDSDVDITEPRLMGFDFSRPSLESEPSIDNRDHSRVDLYIHPQRQGHNPPRYRAVHDYYSLAICLIAIMWWRPINSVEKKFREKHGPEGTSLQWQEFIQFEASTSLKALGGELYAEAVLACLTGQFSLTSWSQGDGDEWSCQDVFFTQVVKKLHMCRA